MNTNDANLGLLSNQQNGKYKEPTSNDYDIELQDVNVYDQDYISLDDAKVQHNDIAIPNLQQEPTQMLSSKNQQNQQPKPQQQQQPQQNLQQQQQPQYPRPQYQQTQVYIPQNQFQNSQYNPYYNSQYQSPIDSIYNSVTGIFQQTATIVNSSINQMNAKYSTCQFCRTPQLIQDENKQFQCFQCKQINKPQFSYFQCGTCKTTVMYQQGVSNVIKCTKCNTMNYVQQPNLPNTFYQLQQQSIYQQRPQQQQQPQQPQQQQQPQQNLQQSQTRPPQVPPQQQQSPYQQVPYTQPPPPKQEPKINEAQKIYLAKNQVDPMYENL